MIYQEKYKLAYSVNFVRAKSVIEKLMPISEIMMYGKRNTGMQLFCGFACLPHQQI